MISRLFKNYQRSLSLLALILSSSLIVAAQDEEEDDYISPVRPTVFDSAKVEENQPRGIYLLGALIYKVNKRLHFDIGVCPGFGRDAPKVRIFAGLTVVANLYGKK